MRSSRRTCAIPAKACRVDRPGTWYLAYADSSASWSSSMSAPALVTSVGFRPFSIVSFVITHLETSFRDGSSNITSSSAFSMIERRPRAPVSRWSALSAIDQSASSVNTRSMSSYAKKRWYCLVSAFFGSVRICTRSSRFSWCTALRTGRRPMNSGISPEIEEILGHDLAEQLGALRVALRRDLTTEADGVLADALGDDLVEAGKRAAADEEDVRRVDREEPLVRMLAAALRRNRCDSALENL